MTNQDTEKQVSSYHELSPHGPTLGPLPDHLKAPNGLSQDVHYINLAITALILEAEAGYRWLNRTSPSADAAELSFSRVLEHAQRLDLLVRNLVARRPND